MDKKSYVLQLIELFKILEKKTSILAAAFKLLDAAEQDVFLNEAYQWIYNQFNQPQNGVDSLPDYFADERTNDLIELYKG